VTPAGFVLSDERLEQLRRGVGQVLDAVDDGDYVPVGHIPRRDGVPDGVRGGEDLFAVAVAPEIIDMVEQVIGSDIVLWSSNIFGKPSRGGKAVQWHQDGHYWPMRPLATCSVWMSVDGASVENGCLRIIPGSHLGGLLPHTDEHTEGVLHYSIERDLLDGVQPRDVVLAPGEVSLHDVNLIHGSNPNRSDGRRAGFVARFMPAWSSYDRTNPPMKVRSGTTPNYGSRPIWLVRGENRHPGNDFTIGHEGLADLDELVAQHRAIA
jgi:ectoine hydroxylase-related dioxygenase (phytanoyl-CoA dioxygenase family)